MMALLVLVLLIPVQGVSKETVLEKFHNYEMCMEARDYVAQEMDKSYPGEQGTIWVLKCRVPGEEA